MAKEPPIRRRAQSSRPVDPEFDGAADSAEPTPDAPAAEQETASPSETAPRFRRLPRPVRVRQSWLRRHGQKTAWALGIVLVAALGIGSLIHWIYHSPRFALESLRQITVLGARQVTPAQVRQIFAADLGRNVFFIPLRRRLRALDQLPWVKSAALLRLWPNQLQVRLTERQPVALARVGHGMEYIDAGGVLLPIPPHAAFQGAVLSGLAGAAHGNPGDADRRKIQVAAFLQLRQALHQQKLSAAQAFAEIDVSDPRNLRALVTPAAAGGRSLLLDLGRRHFGRRYRLYLQHVNHWLASYPLLQSVDLRYDGEAILNTGAARAAAVSR